MAINISSLALSGLLLLFMIHGINSSMIPNTRNRVITVPDLCSSPEFDAITRTNDGNTYIFKGSYYWRILEGGLAPGYPRFIQRDWPGLPANIDAALTWRDGKTFFFKGDSYWRFKSRVPVSGYPKKINVGFAGIPDDIDAALLWGGNANSYFFKGDQYWKFETQSSRKKTAFGYPKNISLWAGVPANLNAAFQWENSKSYFFKGNQYYGFDDREFKVERHEDLPYPRSTATWWFGCKIETATTLSSINSPNVISTLATTDAEQWMAETPTTSITKIVTIDGIDDSFVKDQPHLVDTSSQKDNMSTSTDKPTKAESTEPELANTIGSSINERDTGTNNSENQSNIPYTTMSAELSEIDPEISSTKAVDSFVDNRNEFDLSEPLDDKTTSTDSSSQIVEAKAVTHSDSTQNFEAKAVTHSDSTQNFEAKAVTHLDSTKTVEEKAVTHLDSTQIVEEKAVTHSDSTQTVEAKAITHSDSTQNFEAKAVTHLDSTQIVEGKAGTHSDISTQIVEGKAGTHSDISTQNVELKGIIHTESSTQYVDAKAVAHISHVHKNGATKYTIGFSSIAIMFFSTIYFWFAK